MTTPTDVLLGEIARIATHPAEQAHSMPPGVYTDEGLLALETERLFSKGWICLGRGDAMARPGDYITWTIGDQPVFAMRQNDGSVRAFANVCLHRMMVMLPEACGHAKRIVCPYHAWTYTSDGQLMGAPQMDRTAGFDKKAMHLPELKCTLWQGWVFVSLNPQAPDLDETLAPLAAETSRFRQEHYVEVVRQDHVWQTNWKLLTENFMESYHLPVAHRATVGAWCPIDEVHFAPDFDPAFAWQTFPKDAGAKYGVAHPANTHLEGVWRHTSIMPTIFPAHMFVLAPDHLWYLTLMPKGTGEVAVRFGAALAPERLAALGDPAPFLKETIDFFDLVNAEDRMVVEGIYRGARAPLSKPGPLSWMERSIHDFIRYLALNLIGDR